MNERVAALLAGIGGVTLLVSAIGGPHLPPGDTIGLVSVGAAVPLAVMLIRTARRRNAALVAYEISGNELSGKKLVERLKTLPMVIRAIGSAHGPGALMEVCGRRGCKLLVLLPKDDNVEHLLRGLFAGAKLRKRVVRGIEDLLVDGEAEPVQLPIDRDFVEEAVGAETRGEILLGIAVEDGREIRSSVEEFWRHTGIFGTTGSGKTTTTAFIVAQLSRYVRVLVIDWHGEYPYLLDKMGVEYTQLEPPRLPLVPDDLDIEVTVDVLEDAFDLTRHQAMLLYHALRSMNRRDALPEELEEFTDNLLATIEVQQTIPSRAELEIRAALERRIKSLVTGEGKRLFSVRGHVELPEERGLYVINVHRILLLPLRRVYTRMLLAYMYYTAIALGRMLDTIVVLEEAHNIASSDAKTIPSILAEARKRHLGLIIVTQSPSSLHPSVLKNTNIRIIHTLKSAYDISVVSRSMSIPPELRVKLARLPVGYAILDTPQLEQPTLAYIPALEASEATRSVAKGSVSQSTA